MVVMKVAKIHGKIHCGSVLMVPRSEPGVGPSLGEDDGEQVTDSRKLAKWGDAQGFPISFCST